MKPLEGLRILAIEQFGAGPYGDHSLPTSGPKSSRSKMRRAVAIPLATPALICSAPRTASISRAGIPASTALCSISNRRRAGKRWRRWSSTSDAVVNNLRGDQPDKLEIDYASLQPLNPAIVCLHISAYGRDNERKAWPGYDYLMQAEAGLMSITGEPDGPPSRFGPSIVDYMTGMVGMVGLLSCLMRARQTGKAATWTLACLMWRCINSATPRHGSSTMATSPNGCPAVRIFRWRRFRPFRPRTAGYSSCA